MSRKIIEPEKFYITTPIYYANAKPHIGHAYTTVAADVLARWNKLNGKKTFFLTGTDEHGLKIQKVAEKSGRDPQLFVDEISSEFKTLWKKLNINYDNFIRTTDSVHKKTVQKALQELWNKKAIYKGVYEGLYCVGCEQFKTENELVDGKCPDHNAIPEHLKEECYLLKMSGDIQKQLVEKIKGNDDFQIMPERYKNEILSFLKNQSLKDVSISRKNVSWGIPLPFDPSHTTYVWVDAFLNYLTGLGWEGDQKKPPKQWPPDVQLIGKDILRVHATIWPIMLMHLGISLPKKLFTHGHILAGGKKMSKTLGNVIAVDDMINKFGVDATRYLLISAGTFGEDVDLTMERAAEKYEADLQNGLGNLVARVLTMVENYFDGKIPKAKKNALVPLEVARGVFKAGEFVVKAPYEIKEAIFGISKFEIFDARMSMFKLNFALYEIISQNMALLDSYIDFYKPFKIIKNDKETTAVVLYNCTESIRLIAWSVKPFMPETSDKIFAQLFADEKERAAELGKSFLDAQKWGGLKAGTKIKKGENLFPRLS